MARENTAWFETLGQWLNLERDAVAERIAQLRATLDLSARVARGIALDPLVCVDDRVGLGGRIIVDLEHPERAPLETRIGAGDIVSVHPRRSATAQQHEALRAVVHRRQRERLSLSFDDTPPGWLIEGRVTVELEADEVTFTRARGVLDALASARDAGANRRRALLTGEVEPWVARPPEVVPAEGLNPEQREALTRALAAEELYIVHGPPGTGKTTALVAFVAAEVARGRKVLCLAPSNAAVDHLTERLAHADLDPVRVGHPARVSVALHPLTLDARVERQAEYSVAQSLFAEGFGLMGYARKQRAQGRSAHRMSNARSAREEGRAMLNEARAMERRATAVVLDRARVIAATCSVAAGHDLRSLDFDVAVLDEATQAIEPLALVAFLRAPKVVLGGDHLQLGPTVISPRAAQAGLGRSLFERLIARFGEGHSTLLREQHRMHAAIMEFASHATYHGALRAHPSVAARDLSDRVSAEAVLDAPPVLFLDTSGRGANEESPGDSESLENPDEARWVVGQALRLVGAGLAPGELAMVTPYAAQVARLRDEARRGGLSDEVEIDTVDAFQGREKDAILVSCVRSNDTGTLGFLNDLRRMNVAFTRARRHLFVVGDLGTLVTQRYFSDFADHAAAHGGARTVWDWPDAGDG